MSKILQNSNFRAAKMVNMAVFDLLVSAKIDFTWNQSGSRIVKIPHCVKKVLPILLFCTKLLFLLFLQAYFQKHTKILNTSSIKPGVCLSYNTFLQKMWTWPNATTGWLLLFCCVCPHYYSLREYEKVCRDSHHFNLKLFALYLHPSGSDKKHEWALHYTTSHKRLKLNVN